jgi:hypothetical protein
MLYDVAILQTPTKKEIEDSGAEEKLVFGPVQVIARDPQAAAMRAVMANMDKIRDIDQARMNVLVRPFA